jgi:hypothetical protein
MGQKVQTYIEKYVYDSENQQSKPESQNIQEQMEQLNFSALAILFRVLKIIRMQDSLG